MSYPLGDSKTGSAENIKRYKRVRVVIVPIFYKTNCSIITVSLLLIDKLIFAT
jgi:hypothetical protein